MQFTDILTQASSYAGIHVESKKRAFELISHLFGEAHPDLEPRLLFEALNTRERIGNTGINKGVAIPHGTIKDITEPLVSLIQLDPSIHYDAADKEPVDLLFAVLIPQSSVHSHPKQHAMLLKHIEILCHQPTYCRQLRTAKNSSDLYTRALSFNTYEDPQVHS